MDDEFIKRMLLYYLRHSPAVQIQDESALNKSLDAAIADIQWTYSMIQEEKQSLIVKSLRALGKRLHNFITRHSCVVE